VTVHPRSMRALEALDVGRIDFDAVVPGQALGTDGRAEVVVDLRPGRFAALKRWARGERRTLLDLRASAPYLVEGLLRKVVVVADPPVERDRLPLFQGPLTPAAARLLDELDLLGIRIGRARLCRDEPGTAELERGDPAADSGSAAADFRLLADYVAERVRKATGVRLTPGFVVHAEKPK